MASAPKSLFGKRLREARLRVNMPQDILGVNIGLDESCSSARISRYETGMHEPPFEVACRLANVLGIPETYFYCVSDQMAELLIATHNMEDKTLQEIIAFIKRTKQAL